MEYIACALFITADVVGRQFGYSSASTIEITGYMLATGIAWGLAHALARRAHIRVDVWVNRLPLKLRAVLHLLALLLLGGFAAFCAWSALALVDESLLFDAHDNSALRVPLVVPQGIWTFGILAFCVMILMLALECALSLLLGRPEELDRLLGARTLEDETAEALEAVEMARGGAAR
ncbi:TRAP transporter small permease subunit [Siccirubricoccus deserti]